MGNENLNLAQKILALSVSLSQSGRYQVMCDYSGHIDQLSVWVHPGNQTWNMGEKVEYLMEGKASVTSTVQLESLLAKLEALA